jgi:hypothetical protein
MSLTRHEYRRLLTSLRFKYGFAIVNHLARTLRRSIAFGYDIGCTFGRAVRKHPILGPLLVELRLQFLVGSFHGAGHSRICQCCNLPLYRDGAGCEGFEECESWFSKSNNLASTTRTATTFRRKQAIENYVEHANRTDAYSGLCEPSCSINHLSTLTVRHSEAACHQVQSCTRHQGP